MSWNAPPGTARIQIFRDGWLLDDFAAGPFSYTDSLLWKSTTYWFEFKALDASGAVLTDLAAPVTTPAQVGSFPRPYADDSFWNTPIGPDPLIDPNSVTMVATSITPTAGIATFNNDDDWGIPLAYSDPASKQYSVGISFTPVSWISASLDLWQVELTDRISALSGRR